MGKYTIVSDISNLIIKLLREHLVPDVISNPDNIGLCSPGDRGDFTLCIFLCDIRENEEYRLTGMQTVEINKQKYPPMYLSLYYMITAYSISDIRFRAEEEQKILGKILQVFKDNAIINKETLEWSDTINPLDIHINLLSLDNEEKMKLWNIPNQAYKLSLFYKVAPVSLESIKTKEIQRVVDIDFRIHES